jgi:hypothetical protein
MAKNPVKKLEWILLIHQLPPKPTNLRVRIWRKLQKLGSVAIKNSVYVLSATMFGFRVSTLLTHTREFVILYLRRGRTGG